MNFSTMFANEETGEYWPELQAEIDRWGQVLSDDPGALNHLIFTHMEASHLRRQLAECRGQLDAATRLHAVEIASQEAEIAELKADLAFVQQHGFVPARRKVQP